MVRNIFFEIINRRSHPKMYILNDQENITNPDKKLSKLKNIHKMNDSGDNGESSRSGAARYDKDKGNSQKIYSLDSNYIKYIAKDNPFA